MNNNITQRKFIKILKKTSDMIISEMLEDDKMADKFGYDLTKTSSYSDKPLGFRLNKIEEHFQELSSSSDNEKPYHWAAIYTIINGLG